jgi:hypothetical protein
MKYIAFLSAAVLLASSASGQAPQNRPAPGETLSAITSLQREYGLLKANLMHAAEIMPELEYFFRPSPDIRNYGELIGHAANSQFSECARIIGAPNPNQGTNHERHTTKGEFVKGLDASFAFCDELFSSLTQEKLQEVFQQGEGGMTRLGYLVHMLAHSSEVNGIVSVYMRLKGLTPRLTDEGMGSRRPELVAACANTTVPGTVTKVNAVTGEMDIRTRDNLILTLRADINTVFHIPNATKEDLRPAALSRSLPNARVEVNYCTKELWVREVRVQK